MKTWNVAVPITGIAYVDVQADDEEAAIEAALNSNSLTIDAIETWEAHEHVTQGNFCYAMLNDAEAELIDDDEAQS